MLQFGTPPRDVCHTHTQSKETTMTITSTSFLLDGDTAVWVGGPELALYDDDNRPCDTCGGSGAETTGPDSWTSNDCPDCDGTGRHTFTVEVMLRDADPLHPFHRTHRVHVIDVLPIMERPAGPVNGDGAMVYFFGLCWWLWIDGSHYEPITLPPDAEPGKHLVRLAVHS